MIDQVAWTKGFVTGRVPGHGPQPRLAEPAALRKTGTVKGAA